MKPQTANSVVQSARCNHRDPKGRQCRTLALDARSGLCPRHLAEQQHELAADHFAHLTTRCHFFQTAQGINYSLMNLYQLLAQNRISPRRAAVLSYISSLLLRTLPQIDADRAAGIVDPTKKPLPINVPVAVQHAASEDDLNEDEVEESELVPTSDSDTNSHADMCADTVSDAKPDHKPRSADTWDPSLPEPDPKKKPS
jgi:hypothetical protein